MPSASTHEQVQAVVGASRLPAGVTIRPWEESDFAAIQRLSDEEGWPTPRQRPREALLAWWRS